MSRFVFLPSVKKNVSADLELPYILGKYEVALNPGIEAKKC